MSEISKKAETGTTLKVGSWLRFVSIIDTINEYVGKGVGYGVFPIVGIVLYEVIARFVFNKPTIWAYETTTFVFGAYGVLAGGYLLFHNRHVRVDVIWSLFSAKGKALADVITSILSLTFIVCLLWYAIPYAWHSFEIQETVPFSVFAPILWPIKTCLVLGTFFLLLQLIAKLIRDIHMVAKGTVIEG